MRKSLLLALSIFSLIQIARGVTCATDATYSASSSACLCNTGFYGKDASQSGTCTLCPSGTTTAAPSNTTGGGNTATDTTVSVCKLCNNNYYMKSTATNSKSATCLPCTNGSGNTTNESAVGDVSSCNICQTNYYMTAAAVAGTSAASCTQCSGGSGTASAATTVGDASACNQCLAGYYMTVAAVAASSSASCTACPANSYSSVQTAVGSISQCTCFDSNAMALSTSNTTCVCNNGFSGTVATVSGANTGCTQCASGFQSSSGSACIACPNGSVISADQGSCICYDTSSGMAGWSQSVNACQCEDNYYGDPSTAVAGTKGSCTPCPTANSAPQGTTLSSGCTVNFIYSSILTLSLAFFSVFILI